MTQNVDEGFVVLVHIPLGAGSPYRDAYLVGGSTHEDAEAKIKDLYPGEANIRLYVSLLRGDDTKGLELTSNEVRPWSTSFLD